VDPGKYLPAGAHPWQGRLADIWGLFVGLAAWADAVVGTFDARNRVGLGYLMTS